MKEANASLTTDVVLFALHRFTDEWHVLLIQRGHEPFAGCYALPGGYVEPHEHPVDAAARELAEETGLTVAVDHLIDVGTYAAPNRDPRGRVVSVAYCAELPTMRVPTAGDDAAAARWVPIREALGTGLAFDHDVILRDALGKADLPGLSPFDVDQTTAHTL